MHVLVPVLLPSYSNWELGPVKWALCIEPSQTIITLLMCGRHHRCHCDFV
jgi:hypothetical protein